MSEKIHVRARKFLHEFFSDEELTNFCFDYFPLVYNDFTVGMPKSQKVRMLVENSQRRGRFDELLAALERERPKSYSEHFAEQPQQIDPKPKPVKIIERNPRQVFISHSSQDADVAQKLSADLRAQGWQTWIAPDSIRPGEKWVEAINRGLAESGVLVLLLTKEAAASTYVRDETNHAIELMRHGDTVRVIPVEIEPVSPGDIPFTWSSLQRISFRENYEGGLRTLLHELNPQSHPLPSAAPPEKPLLTQVVERMKHLPTLVWAGGGLILLLVLVMSFWPERDNGSIDLPTEMAEVIISTQDETEATNTPQPVPSETPNNLIPTVNPTETNTITPTPTSTSTPTINPNIPPINASLGDRWTRGVDEMEMVYVPEGTFLMGSDFNLDPLAETDEIPQRLVRLDRFWIDRTEVTNAQFSEFLNSNGNRFEGGVEWINLNDTNVKIELNDLTYSPKAGFSNHPVNLVSWHGAEAYCEWVGGALPSEAQWEYAARGSNGNIFPWGNQEPTCNLAQFGGCGGLIEVSSLSPEGDSWVGAADMSGNVWEWVVDWYDEGYYENGSTNEPTGPSSGTEKVLRGGGWYRVEPIYFRSANRFKRSPIDSDVLTGFRCVLPSDQ